MTKTITSAVKFNDIWIGLSFNDTTWPYTSYALRTGVGPTKKSAKSNALHNSAEYLVSERLLHSPHLSMEKAVEICIVDALKEISYPEDNKDLRLAVFIRRVMHAVRKDESRLNEARARSNDDVEIKRAIEWVSATLKLNSNEHETKEKNFVFMHQDSITGLEFSNVLSNTPPHEVTYLMTDTMRAAFEKDGSFNLKYREPKYEPEYLDSRLAGWEISFK